MKKYIIPMKKTIINISIPNKTVSLQSKQK